MSLGSRDIESSVCKVMLSLDNVDLAPALRLECGHPLNLVAFHFIGRLPQMSVTYRYICSHVYSKHRLNSYVYEQHIIAVA